MDKNKLKKGDTAPKTGIYLLKKDKGNALESVTLRRGDILPYDEF